MFAPCRGVAHNHTVQRGSQNLVRSLRLPISLWVITRRLVEAPSARQKAFHTWEINWGPRSETRSAGKQLYEQLGGFRGNGELGEGNKVNSLGKLVQDGENDCAIRGGKTGYKI